MWHHHSALELASQVVNFYVVNTSSVSEHIVTNTHQELDRWASLLAGIDTTKELASCPPQVLVPGHAEIMDVQGGPLCTLGHYVSGKKICCAVEECQTHHGKLFPYLWTWISYTRNQVSCKNTSVKLRQL